MGCKKCSPARQIRWQIGPLRKVGAGAPELKVKDFRSVFEMHRKDNFKVTIAQRKFSKKHGDLAKRNLVFFDLRWFWYVFIFKLLAYGQTVAYLKDLDE